jgi:hypothetical protein
MLNWFTTRQASGTVRSYSCPFQMARLHKLNNRKGWTDTPIAIQNSGSIRSSVDASSKEGKSTSLISNVV